MHAHAVLTRAPFKLATLCGLIALAHAANAQTTAPETLPAITVQSTLAPTPLEQTPASISVIDGDNARDRQWQVNLSEALPGVPGLLLQNRQNYAQDLQLSIRGHGARSTFGVRGVQIFVDGIPSTMPDGQGQISNIDLSSAERIEVLRGPYSALYGNSAGGVLNVYTERGEGAPQVDSTFALGSDGQKRIGLKAKGEANGIGYVVSASRYLTAGWRKQSAADKNLLNARIDTQIGNDGHLTLVASHVAIDALDPGGLPPADWAANPRAVAKNPIDYNSRKTTRQTQAGLTYEHRLDGANTLRMMVYAGEREIVQYQSTPATSQTAATSAGGVIDLQRRYGGTDLRWAHSGELASRPFNIVAGLAANIVEEDRRGYNNFIGTTLGVEGALRRKERNTLTNIDPYAQVSWNFAPDWTAQAGVRWSNVQLESRDKYIVTGNGDDSGNTSYHRALPLLSLQYRVSDSANAFASIGSGFETPTFNEISYRPASQPGLNFDLEPATSTSAEIGWKQRYAVGESMRGEWTAALFQTRTRNEIVVAENVGGRSSFQNAGRTKRQGVELSNSTRLADQLHLNAAFTWLDATLSEGYCDAKGAGCVPAGKRIAGTARTQAYLALDWRPSPAFRAGVDWRRIGSVAANDSNSVMAPAYGVLGASASYNVLAGGWKVGVFGRVDNLADRKYVGSVIVNESNGRFYESAPGRQWMVGVNAGYQF
ncbi:TonB-dependent receptor [Diaphorobacter sp. HDW4A]|uniref:TonB-dependent receptor family protein n=1 Tax=Diaphorobacter sp. HDW4A TaxID=2714924 RepID=UPI00140D157B|nr:TonB-dependent receptor [Diaphorobacter sp. HDW4A]QIL82578.1 TonB-dependent receptor [Diaphorobacter sp. HDW4A]